MNLREKKKLTGMSNFYVVRNLSMNSDGKPYQIRNSEDPSVVWGEFESAASARDNIKEAYINLEIKEAFGQFLQDTALTLDLTAEEVKERL